MGGLRSASRAEDRVGPLLDLLFGLAADQSDPPSGETARWIAHAEGVDVVAARLPPARPDAAPPPATGWRAAPAGGLPAH
ncbi:hypothetical protein HCB17_03070 [Salinispora arenicola]|uniref:Uncharacterized protein n=1 Tax=Salinispora arenicola (strain CNS-205) TaxID=391037 RepID=A8LX09_SALAI|nr:hypothetical protein [Salinispora arenicola]NIL40264.1 hypothetical protein [Salinispora arenicola]